MFLVERELGSQHVWKIETHFWDLSLKLQNNNEKIVE